MRNDEYVGKDFHTGGKSTGDKVSTLKNKNISKLLEQIKNTHSEISFSLDRQHVLYVIKYNNSNIYLVLRKTRLES